MVEYTFPLDSMFGSLADPTRRDILERVAKAELTVSEIALPYDMSLAAVSKHLKILERAKLVIKRRRGKEQLVSMNAQGLADANSYLQQYKEMWEQRLDSLGEYLQSST
ncbi:MAG TPA: metalloregulator ArsR/SmtB family transcription factor [Candidatus Saccharimonadales bacterium]|nr:metalloregulator ArsR/SmtB family transcription factor [Candidatus Saccharimonadales bacterium]